MQQVPVESTQRNHVAVPVAFALESAVMDANVKTPEAMVDLHGSVNVSSASRVVADPQVAGRVLS
jgi:hypothetical protein